MAAVTPGAGDSDGDDADDGWRVAAAPARRPARRTRALATATFYEGAHGDAARAAWRARTADMDARLAAQRAEREAGCVRVFAKQASDAADASASSFQ